MKRTRILTKLEHAGIIAVVRADSQGEAVKASDAIIAGGMKGIELTFTVPQADLAIKELVNKYRDVEDVVIGAGTVLDATTARLAILAGAEFIVSPSFDKDAAEICNLYQIPYMPGCMTITEMQVAMKSGVDIIKLFPGSIAGPSTVKAFKAPLPQANIMPTGGVSLDNVEDWFESGVIAVGVGGSLLAPLTTGNYAKITSIAEQYIDKLHKIKG